MRVSKLSKPFYLGAITLFAATALAVAHPVVSHADDTNSNPLSSLDAPDQYGLTFKDYTTYNHDDIANSSLPQDKKETFLGLSDGLYNRTKDTSLNSTNYNAGYFMGQIYTQGWLTYQKYGDDTSKVPYATAFVSQSDPSSNGNNANDTGIAAAYYGYRDGLNKAKGNFDQVYTPSSDGLNEQIYNFAYTKAESDYKNNVSFADNTHNSTPFGFSINDTNAVNSLVSQFHTNSLILTSNASGNVPSTVLTLDNSGNVFENGNTNLGSLISLTGSSATTSSTSNTPNSSNTSDNSSSDSSNNDASNTNNDDSNNSSSDSTNTSSDSNTTMSDNTVTPIITIHHKKVTTYKVKKVVKKHVKKTTKKHAKKRYVVKKHVKKSKVKKLHAKFPRTVWANHRTGIHSVPQFNHGRTYFVVKGHKFHVYAKVSDGHGNWRYKVGKHKYITTIPGSINKHYVSYTHHHAKHHHRH